jgi:glutamyl-tRNA reductase
MQTQGPLNRFHAASLSIASHDLECLSEFPDSRAFYAENTVSLPPEIPGLLYMATCNRIEVYAEFADGISEETGFQTLATISPVFSRLLSKKPQTFQGGKVLAHLISVASGLKSLALGETQIAGQIKRDMAHAEERGWSSPGMATLLKKALETQKKIRTSTGISENSYSLMSLVEEAVAERGLHPMENTVVLVGASEMSAKVARFALRRNVANFILVRKDTNREMNGEMRQIIDANKEKFREMTLADFKATQEKIAASTIVLASTAPHPLFTAGDIRVLTERGALAANAAVVDLSLPANVASDAALALSSRLISLSSLQQISEEARAERASSALEAEPIIRRAVYQLWLDSLYRENPEVVRNYIENKSDQSESEWLRLADEAALSEKQKRIMYDFIKKEQRRALQQHREMILELIAGASSTPSL